MTPNTTTLYDLNATAAAAHDRLDFAAWQDYYHAHIQNYTNLKARLSPSAAAAEAAAKAAAALAASQAQAAAQAAAAAGRVSPPGVPAAN